MDPSFRSGAHGCLYATESTFLINVLLYLWSCFGTLNRVEAEICISGHAQDCSQADYRAQEIPGSNSCRFALHFSKPMIVADLRYMVHG